MYIDIVLKYVYFGGFVFGDSISFFNVKMRDCFYLELLCSIIFEKVLILSCM